MMTDVFSFCSDRIRMMAMMFIRLSDFLSLFLKKDLFISCMCSLHPQHGIPRKRDP